MHLQPPSVLVALGMGAYLVLLINAVRQRSPRKILGSLIMVAAITAIYLEACLFPHTPFPVTLKQTLLELSIAGFMTAGAYIYMYSRHESPVPLLKNIFFWICYLPMGLGLIISSGVTALAEIYEHLCQRFENWCFSRKTN